MAIINISSYITSAGLKAVTSAGGIGPYFAVKYFVPFYDPSFDASIALSNSVSSTPIAVSALNLSAATTVPGERIFASSASNYTLSKNVFFYQRSGMNTISNGSNGTLSTKQEMPASVNMLSGKPLTQVVSAASFLPTTTVGAFSLTNATNITGTNLASFDALSAKPYKAVDFFRVQSYSPKATGTSACGVYKCRIPAGDGTFKFNGLALFVSRTDSYGFDTYGYSPELFAFVVFDKPQIKTDATGGLNSFEIDIDLGFDFSTYITTGSPVYYETNYWTKVPLSSNTSAYALNYDGDVVISSSATPGSWTPRAKLTITQNDQAALRLASNDLKFFDFKVDRYGLNNKAIPANDNTDLAVLSIDTGCPDDSLLQLGYKTSATGIKSIAMGCNALAYGYAGTVPMAYENSYTPVDGGYTISMGVDTSAGGFASIAMGKSTFAHGFGCFAGGYGSIAVNTIKNDASYEPATDTGFNFSYGYMTSAISDPSYSCSYNTDYIGNNIDYGSMGGNIAMGQQSLAKGSHNIAIGMASSAVGDSSVAIGKYNSSDGCYTYTFGYSNSAHGPGSVAIGLNNIAAAGNNGSQYHSMAFGSMSSATGNQSIAIGYRAKASGASSIAIGAYTSYNSEIGQAETVGMQSVAIGMAKAAADRSFAIGFMTSSTSEGAVSIGFRSLASGKHSVALGYLNVAQGESSVAFGYQTSAMMSQSFTFGSSTYANGYNSFAGGYSSSAIGSLAFVYGSNSVARTGALAFGANTSAGNNTIALGYQTTATGFDSGILGSRNNMPNGYSFVLGSNNNNSGGGSNATIIGSNNTLTATNSIVIGNNISNLSISNAIQIGSCSYATSIKGHDITIGGDCTDTITLDSTYLSITGQIAQDPKIGLYITNTDTGFDFTITRLINDIWTRTIRIVPALGVPFVNDSPNAPLGTVINESSFNSTSRCAFFYNPLTETVKIISYKDNIANYMYTDLSTNNTDVWHLLYEINVPGLNSSVIHHKIYPSNIVKSIKITAALNGGHDDDGGVNILSQGVKITKDKGTKYVSIVDIVDCYGVISKFGGSGDSGVRLQVDGHDAIYIRGHSIIGETARRFGISSGSGVIGNGPIYWHY